MHINKPAHAYVFSCISYCIGLGCRKVATTRTITHHPAGLRFELHCRCCFIGLLHLWLFLSNNLFLAQSVSLVPEVNHWNHSKHNPDTNCSPPLLSQSLGANYEMKEHLMFLHAPPPKKKKNTNHSIMQNAKRNRKAPDCQGGQTRSL